MSYRTADGECWDAIARAVYGDEYRADVLMRANPEWMEYTRLPAGVNLVTPVLEEEAENDLPPWKAKG